MKYHFLSLEKFLSMYHFYFFLSQHFFLFTQFPSTEADNKHSIKIKYYLPLSLSLYFLFLFDMYGIHIFSSLKISNKNILKNILEI